MRPTTDGQDTCNTETVLQAPAGRTLLQEPACDAAGRYARVFVDGVAAGQAAGVREQVTRWTASPAAPNSGIRRRIRSSTDTEPSNTDDTISPAVNGVVTDAVKHPVVAEVLQPALLSRTTLRHDRGGPARDTDDNARRSIGEASDRRPAGPRARRPHTSTHMNLAEQAPEGVRVRPIRDTR